MTTCLIESIMATSRSHALSNVAKNRNCKLIPRNRNIVIDAKCMKLFIFIFCIQILSIISAQGVSQIIFDSRQLIPSDVEVLISEGYHNTTETLSAAINRLVQIYPNLVESFIIGNSVAKNPILGIKISSSKLFAQKAALPRPGVVLLGGIHGDHALGHELVLYIGAFLLKSYGIDNNSRVTNLIDSADIFLIPTLNPDGFQLATEGDCFSAKMNSGRNNKNRVDLDQDFKFHNYNDISAVLANNKLQPETKAFLEWIVTGGKSVQLLATLRTGLTGIIYPFDEIPNQITEHTYGIFGASTSPNAAPDRSFFEFLGHDVYYKFQDEPINSTCNPIANNVTVLDGARVGSTYGTLSDFLYRFTNIFPLNIYLDCCKYPHRKSLGTKWLQHANSLFAFLESINLGIRGVVLDRSNSKPIQNARISVEGIERNVTTGVDGKYWRPLIPGQAFNLIVDADGYRPATRSHVNGSHFDLSTGLIDSNVITFKLISLSSQATTELGTTEKEGANLNLGLDNLPSNQKFKPEALFKNVDKQIQKLDFKTPTELHKHHNYVELVAFIKDLNKQYPKISRLYNIGESLKGRKLWVLEISDRPGEHQLMKPEFRYIANMHGNEVVGRELLLNLAKLILENYGTNDLVTALVNSTRIHLLPSMNPDGYEKSVEGDCESDLGRANANDMDLNRNFPDRFGPTGENNDIQPEVRAIMNWSHEYPFVLGANLHGGSLVANYPFDGNLQKKNGVYEASSDDSLFVQLARTYSTNHPTMSKGEHCYDICGNDKASLLNERFKDGITNGAQWYVLYGGIQDWVYLHTNCLSITVELGCMKYPYAKDLPRYWSDNKKPLIKYMLEIHRGIYGVVTDQNGQPLSNATIHVRGIDHDVYSAASGDYWRILLPGDHFVSVSKEGYRTAHRTVTVVNGYSAKRVDFSLSSGPKDLSYEIGSINELDQSSAAEQIMSSEFVSKSTDRTNQIQPGPLSSVGSPDSKIQINPARKHSSNGSLTVDGSRLLPVTQDTKFMIALCFIIVLPSIMLLVYLFGSADNKRYPSRLGFYRLATTAPEDADCDDDNEGTRFMKRPSKINRADLASDSEDELYSADNWSK